MLLSIYIYIYIWDDNWHGKAEVLEEKPVPMSLVQHIFPMNKGPNQYFLRESPTMWHGLDVYSTIRFYFILAVGKLFWAAGDCTYATLTCCHGNKDTEAFFWKPYWVARHPWRHARGNLMNIKWASPRTRALLLVVTYSSADKWIYNTSHCRRFDSA